MDMEKYYYYSYEHKYGTGYGIASTKDSCFPLYEVIMYLEKMLRNHHASESPCVTFWHEISKEEYKKMCKLTNK